MLNIIGHYKKKKNAERQADMRRQVSPWGQLTPSSSRSSASPLIDADADADASEASSWTHILERARALPHCPSQLSSVCSSWALGEEFEAGSITSVFRNRAVVKYSRLEDVLHGCSWKVNNKLDGTYLPLPVDQIIQRTKGMVNKIVQYSLIEGNCEHFVNDLRYGVPRSQQVEHALMEGTKAVGAVISAVVESIRPKPVTA
ncbi:phospholipase A and acyltransferase 5-like [Ailuropoda melanoleuca]|uniref:phospholipase A and acyltransferase 5-like n=1 Tax=Ailuropoda melanoleuca TaxID=9646 RepID=UPI0014944AE9|nr:phospholipase A and acyltransferase 5-like [Ailuropoda melanoleuca]